MVLQYKSIWKIENERQTTNGIAIKSGRMLSDPIIADTPRRWSVSSFSNCFHNCRSNSAKLPFSCLAGGKRNVFSRWITVTQSLTTNTYYILQLFLSCARKVEWRRTGHMRRFMFNEKNMILSDDIREFPISRLSFFKIIISI